MRINWGGVLDSLGTTIVVALYVLAVPALMLVCSHSHLHGIG